MLFNSAQFGLFFCVVYTLYLLLKHRQQNGMLIIASCIFYATWSWKFLLLMFVSITTDYFCSNRIDQTQDKSEKKRFLFLSIFVNLGILGFFKYFNFFASSLSAILTKLFPFAGTWEPTLNIILPVGISFYTFEAISYTVDVYRGIIKPAKSYWDYVLFVIYFPHLVAGPIMRAKDFLPQITSPRILKLEQFYEGCYLIFWGLFQKMFIADNLARVADPIFAPGADPTGPYIVLAMYAFAFQIYCDFDGYSNIARGLGKCMGFDITINFKLPYFATNPEDFWKRWHISLSSWLRDYLYIPLGGNRRGALITCRNIMITMFLGGLWHGANWTFVLWGIYHGLLIVGYKLIARIQKPVLFPQLATHKVWKGLKIIFFFHLVCFGWLIFRVESLPHLAHLLRNLFDFHFLQTIGIKGFILYLSTETVYLCFLLAPLLLIQFFQWRKNDMLAVFHAPVLVRGLCYTSLYILIRLFLPENAQQFIYFQF